MHRIFFHPVDLVILSMKASPTMRKLLGLILLVVVYLVGFVVIMEIGVRVFGAAPLAEPPGFFWRVPDPIAGWSLEPGAHGRWYNPSYEYDTQVQINSLGLRSPESTYEKPPGVFRILVLGDSYIEGLQVELAETLPQQLAKQLNAAREANDGQPKTVEAINAGVSNWGTDNQLLWLREEGVKYDPDLIVLAFYPGNDFMNNWAPLEYANTPIVRKPWFELVEGELVLHDSPFDPQQVDESRRRLRQMAQEIETVAAPTQQVEIEPGLLQPVGDLLKRSSAFYRYLDPRLRRAAPGFAAWLGRLGILTPGQESSDLAQGASFIPLAYGVYEDPPGQTWQESFALTGALLTEMKQTADEMGVPIRAIVLTAPEQIDAERWQRTLAAYPAMQKHTWSLDQPARQALALLSTANIPALDLTPIIRAAAQEGERVHLADDGHWTPLGHALAAQSAAAWLTGDPEMVALSGQVAAPQPGRNWLHLLWRVFVWSIVLMLIGSLVWSIYKNGWSVWLRNAGLLAGSAGELLAFTIRRRQVLLLPLVIILLLFGGLLIIAQASVVGPFIYTLF
jgi:hypothetical protein